jgi:signal transduction histidine kinase/ligand-binding sensor protein
MIGSSTSKWPFIPTCLNDILEKETLAVIESGSCERLGRPLTILDFDAQTGKFTHRIESVNEKQRYEDFCHYFRDDSRIAGGDQACKAWDINQANVSLHEFRITGEPYRTFRCHAGLLDMSHIVQIRGKPVALILTGQFCPGNSGMISQTLLELKNKPSSDLQISDANLEALEKLATKLSIMPDNMHTRLEKEAHHIQRIAEAEFELRKRQKEQDFLEELRNSTSMLKSIDREQLERKVFAALRKIKEYCSCKYVLLFAATHENDTVLLPFAHAGLPGKIAQDLPHFNWSKAKLPLDSFTVDEQTFEGESQAAIASGIRGNNRDTFSNAGCMIPNAMGDRYRSVLVFGPFEEEVRIKDERQFLIEIARFIGLFSRTGFEVIFLEQEHKRWKNRAQLLTHEYKTALTTISTPIGVARTIVQRINSREAERADEFLRQAEDRSLMLGRITSGTLDGIAIKVEADDLEIQNYSLSALVENCATGYMKAAGERNLEIVIDPSIYLLPNASIDIPRMTIALENLIENAIKYSFSKSRIFIRSRLNIASGVDQAKAVIEVDNIGFEIPEEDRQRIFEVGERGGSKSRIQRIPGSGYGLWEARSILEAHGGSIYLKITPTSIHKQEGIASRVVFSIEIPLKQKR